MIRTAKAFETRVIACRATPAIGGQSHRHVAVVHRAFGLQVARRAQRQVAALKAVAAEYAAPRDRKLDESRVVRPARKALRLQDGVLLRPEPVAHHVLARLMPEADALGRVQEDLFLRPHRSGLTGRVSSTHS